MNVRRIPQLKKIVVGLAVLLWASSTLAVTGLENWENGLGDYYPDNGVWQVGTPTSGPGKAHQGVSVAGTILAGNYPGYQDSRLISPVIVLPAVQGKERVQLRFWHWFSYSTYDSGTVQISAYDVEADQWEDWTSLVSVYQVSAVWSPMYVDLTAYAGRYVRIAFAHTAQRSGRAVVDAQFVAVHEHDLRASVAVQVHDVAELAPVPVPREIASESCGAV